MTGSILSSHHLALDVQEQDFDFYVFCVDDMVSQQPDCPHFMYCFELDTSFERDIRGIKSAIGYDIANELERSALCEDFGFSFCGEDEYPRPIGLCP